MTLLTTSIQAPRRIGIGVGAVVVNEDGQVLLIQRGPRARNEQGLWATPGGAVERDEIPTEAIIREVWEECGIEIAVLCQLGTFDHQLNDGEQWVSMAYLTQIMKGEPAIREPEKCSACGWFALDALPEPQSPLADKHLAAYCRMQAGMNSGQLVGLLPCTRDGGQDTPGRTPEFSL